MRQQKMVLFFGTNGTGKTTKMLSLGLDYLQANYKTDKRVLCILPDDGERKYDVIKEIMPVKEDLQNFKGIAKVIAEDRKVFETVLKSYTDKGQQRFNGLCIFDDLGVILNRRPEEALNLLRRRRQANMDMFWNFHGLTTDMPRSFFAYATDIVLFKTGDNHEDTMYKLPANKQKEFEDMFFRIEEKTKENPFYCEQLKLR